MPTIVQLIPSYKQQQNSPIVQLNLSSFEGNVTCYFTAN